MEEQAVDTSFLIKLQRVFPQAAQDLKELRSRNAEEARGEYKNKIEKYYKELMKKGEIRV
jgi:hypothetical protein